MIKRQTITAVICALLAAVLAIVYFSVIEPMLLPEEEKVTPIEIIDPLEVRTQDQTRVYMFPPVERARIDKIEVHNKNGGYTFNKSKGDNFYIEGMELAPYDLMAFTYLVTTAGSAVANERYLIDDNTDLTVYGLAASDDPSYFIITDDNDVTHKVWVGNKAKTGDGYYCQYDGRKAVYLIRTAGFEVLLADVYELITPTLGLPIQQSAYSEVSLFGIVKNGKPVVEIRTLSPEENGTDKTEKPTYTYEFTPSSLKEFTPNGAARDSSLNLLSGLAGSKVVDYGTPDVLKEKLKTKYGIDVSNPESWYYCVYYHYTDEAYIYLSAPNEEGMCYAYTSVYNTVVTVPLKSMSIFHLNTHDFLEKNVVNSHISLVNKIEIKGAIADEQISVDSAYGLKSTAVDGTEQTVQTVWNEKTDKQYTADEVANFKQIYGDLLRLYIEGEVDVRNIADADHIASVTVGYTDGTSKTFDFYAYNSTRCYFTVNGNLGDYALWVHRDNVEKVIRDTYRFDLGYTIDPNI